MKNFLKIIVIAAVLCFAAGCENSIGKKTIDENDGDNTDTVTPDEDTDQGDTEVPDDPDTETPDETDSDIPDTTDDEDEEPVDTTDSDDPSEYKTPYGSLTFTFNNLIGPEGDPATSNEVFATGTYGNGTASIKSDFADKVETLAVVQNDSIYIQQTPVYADGSYGNPVVGFYIPFDQANPGIYDVNYNAAVSLIVSEIDWNLRSVTCYHAFGEGQMEISEININYAVTLNGSATLYSPKNYKWDDVSAALLEKFTETNVICDPVD